MVPPDCPTRFEVMFNSALYYFATMMPGPTGSVMLDFLSETTSHLNNWLERNEVPASVIGNWKKPFSSIYYLLPIVYKSLVFL